MQPEPINMRPDIAEAWRNATQEQRHKAEQALAAIFQLEAETQPSRPVSFDDFKHLAGVLDGGPDDLSSNPKYLEGLGERSLQ